MKKILTIGGYLLLCGCAFVPKPSQEELAKIENPPVEIAEKIEVLAGKAEIWINDVSRAEAHQGRSLSENESNYAKSIGVKDLKSVRVVVAETFPVPTDPELKAATEEFGMGGRFEGGRTMDHIIFLKPDYAQSTTVITHELNHVAQFERLGTSRMVRRYIAELMILGYIRSPLELEAYEKQVDALPAK